MTLESRDTPSHSPARSLSLDALRLRAYGAQPSLVRKIDAPKAAGRAFIIAYRSDGLKVFARVDVPATLPPRDGFPVIVFAHGFSPNPQDLNYFQRPYYEAWINAYVQAGFVVVMPGYRGHGVVAGELADGYEYFEKYAPLHLATPFYAVDVLNLIGGLAGVERLEWGKIGLKPLASPLFDPHNLFLAAHSMGGDVALKVLAAADYFRAASLWAGVTASLEDVARFYTAYEMDKAAPAAAVEEQFKLNWNQITAAAQEAPFAFDASSLTCLGTGALEYLHVPLLLHHGTHDLAVPVAWSVSLQERLRTLDRAPTLYLYEGNDHELSLNGDHALAVERDVAFFRQHFNSRR